jgi:TonB family protein
MLQIHQIRALAAQAVLLAAFAGAAVPAAASDANAPTVGTIAATTEAGKTAWSVTLHAAAPDAQTVRLTLYTNEHSYTVDSLVVRFPRAITGRTRDGSRYASSPIFLPLRRGERVHDACVAIAGAPSTETCFIVGQDLGLVTTVYDKGNDATLRRIVARGQVVRAARIRIAPDSADCSAPYSNGRIVSAAQPEFPENARIHGESGSVVLNVSTDANGAVSNVAVATSSGYADLDRAAILAAKNSTYEPGRFRCKALPATLVFEADFKTP